VLRCEGVEPPGATTKKPPSGGPARNLSGEEKGFKKRGFVAKTGEGFFGPHSFHCFSRGFCQGQLHRSRVHRARGGLGGRNRKGDLL